MAKKLLTLASCAAFTLAGVCMIAPMREEPKKEPITAVATASPSDATLLTNETPKAEEPKSTPAAATTPQPSVTTPEPIAVATPAPIKKPRKPRPAALMAPAPVIAEAPAAPVVSAPSLSAQLPSLGEVATPRVDKDDRPATGNVMSRKASYR